MNRVHMILFSLVAAMMFSFGVVLAQADDEATIRGLMEQYAEFYTAGDAEAVAQLFTEEAVFITPDGQLLEGRQEILAFFQQHFEESLPLSMEAIEMEVVNGTAYSTTRYAASSPEGEILFQGYGLSIWNRVDGEWRWYRSVANVILPEPEENGMDGSD